ncbi:hypothetical protein LINPERHAP2_LOCUS33165 [Linum perenne]
MKTEKIIGLLSLYPPINTPFARLLFLELRLTLPPAFSSDPPFLRPPPPRFHFRSTSPPASSSDPTFLRPPPAALISLTPSTAGNPSAASSPGLFDGLQRMSEKTVMFVGDSIRGCGEAEGAGTMAARSRASSKM